MVSSYLEVFSSQKTSTRWIETTLMLWEYLGDFIFENSFKSKLKIMGKCGHVFVIGRNFLMTTI
jgi:hypothetical protein